MVSALAKRLVVVTGLVWLGLPLVAMAEKTPPPPPTVRGDSDVRKPPPRARVKPAPRRVDVRPRVAPRPAPIVPRDAAKPLARPVVAPTKPAKKAPYRKYGIAVRGAALFLPEFFLNFFFDESEGVINGGFGLAFVLKTDPTFEFTFGIGYNFFNFHDAKDSDGRPIPHVFNNKDEESFRREFVFNSLSYLTIDVRFLKTFPVHPRFHFLVGLGLGMGVMFGKIVRTDTYIPGYDPRDERAHKDAYERFRQDPTNPNNALPNKVCETSADSADCKLNQDLSEDDDIKNHSSSATPLGRREDRVPPVIPIFDFVLGFVIPIVLERWDIRVQGGVGVPRLFWVGMSTHVYF